jgi:hypothetical protein
VQITDLSQIKRHFIKVPKSLPKGLYSISYFTNQNIPTPIVVSRRVRIHQRGNQNPQIEDGRTIQWRKEKGQKDKQRSTKHYTKS